MKNIAIIYSKNEPNPAGMELVFGRMAESLCGKKLFPMRIFLEDFEKAECFREKNGEKNMAYFMTNDFGASYYFEKIKTAGWSIVNQGGLEKKQTKLEMQKTMEENNIKVPRSFSNIEEWDGRFPVYVKSQRQLSHVRLAKDSRELSESAAFFRKQKEPYYIEQAIDDNKLTLQKIYYIAGKAFFSGEARLSDKILHRISRTLELEIFSADIFISPGGDYRVIDINPAPGLYRSEDARSVFADYLCRI